MDMANIHFENHLKERVMEIHFPNGYTIDSSEALNTLKTAWTNNLKRWHSPYTLLLDARALHITPTMAEDFKKLFDFFGKFFMRKAVGFCDKNTVISEISSFFPFQIFADYEEAVKHTGLSRGAGLSRDLADLRQRIQIDNDFTAHVMEVSFLADTTLEANDIEILKSKLQNMIMLWHQPFSVLFNCTNLKFTGDAKKSFASLERFLKGFFCKQIIGYGYLGNMDDYPFMVTRVRHQAAAKLEHSGIQSGADASCNSKRQPPSNKN